VAVLLVGTAFLSGCSSSETRFGVEGTVTYDGKPLPLGSIAFHPTGEKGIKAGGPIRDGHYKLDPKFGLNPGPHKVEIRWLKPTGQKYKNEFGEEFDRTTEGLPDKYHKDSTLTADIKPGPNVIDFNLQK
jgi:hypothetical protein